MAVAPLDFESPIVEIEEEILRLEDAPEGEGEGEDEIAFEERLEELRDRLELTRRKIYDNLTRRDCYKLLAAAIAGLNPNRRDVVERTLLGQKVRQICAETNRTPGSVSGLKFNAMVDLRKRLSTEGFLEQCGELFQLTAEAS